MRDKLIRKFINFRNLLISNKYFFKFNIFN
nr:MAG TPA: hypothetical protein [Caudoviricetes sp.]